MMPPKEINVMETRELMVPKGEDVACILLREPLINDVLRSRSLFDDAIELDDFRARLGNVSKLKICSKSADGVVTKQPNGKSMIIMIIDDDETPEDAAKVSIPVYMIKRSKLNKKLPKMILIETEEEHRMDEEPVRMNISLPRWMKEQVEELKNDLCVGYSDVIKLALGQAGFVGPRSQC
jgi:hypothetical protein